MIPANWHEWVTSDAWRSPASSVVPAPPRSFEDVYWLAGENDIDARRLIKIVSQDPIFTIRVLRLANVAAFAAAGDVTSIQIAVVRLGTRAVRNAVLAACMASFAQTIDAYGRRGIVEIQHAVGTGCIARRIAERLRVPADDAFVHGLLHDVGKLVLMKMRSEYRRLGGRPPSQEEFDAVLAEEHAAVGAEALQVWGLPDAVRNAVRWHHDPMKAADDPKSASITYLANRLSHRYGFGHPPDDEKDALASDPVVLSLGLPSGWLERLDQEALSLGVSARHMVG